MSDPVCTQILDALQALLSPTATGAKTVTVDRDLESEPYTPAELPAINIIPVEEGIDSDSMQGAAIGVPILQARELRVVLQVLNRGGSAPARQARAIGATCEVLLASDPTLGGACSQVMRPVARQWVRDDGGEQRLARQNTMLLGGYRTESNNPFTSL